MPCIDYGPNGTNTEMSVARTEQMSIVRAMR